VEESGTKGMRVQVLANDFRAGVGRYFAAVLRQLGYRASARVLDDFGEYFDYLFDHRNRVQLATVGWAADYIAPANFLQVNFACPSFTPGGELNDSEVYDPRINTLIRRAAETQMADPALGLAAWAKADRALSDQAPAVFLDNPRTLVLVSKRVGNYQSHPQFGPLIDQLWVK
jgi:peptide/nickel transport system substrate-binding protein